MTEVMDVLLAPEPEVFDTANKILNTQWVDWYIITNNAEAKHSIEVGNENVKKLLELVEELDDLPSPLLGLQMTALANDIKGYLQNFDVISNLAKTGWLAEIKPEHPSIFETEGDGVDLRAWIIMEAKARGVNKYGFRNFIQTVYMLVSSINLETYIVDEEPAVLESIVSGIPSLLWVLGYASLNKVSLQEAHVAGVTAIKEQQNENPGDVVQEPNA